MWRLRSAISRARCSGVIEGVSLGSLERNAESLTFWTVGYLAGSNTFSFIPSNRRRIAPRLTPRQVAYMIEQHRLPIFRMGAIICSTPEMLDDHFRERLRDAHQQQEGQ